MTPKEIAFAFAAVVTEEKMYINTKKTKQKSVYKRKFQRERERDVCLKSTEITINAGRAPLSRSADRDIYTTRWVQRHSFTVTFPGLHNPSLLSTLCQQSIFVSIKLNPYERGERCWCPEYVPVSISWSNI